MQAAEKLVRDLQNANKDMFVLRALLLLDLSDGGSSGGDFMITKVHAATEPEIWMHCLVSPSDIWLQVGRHGVVTSTSA